MQYDGEVCQLCGGAGLRPMASPGRAVEADSAAGPLAPNVANALCYVLGPLTGMLFLAWPRYNREKSIRFNALQSIFFFTIYVLFLFSLQIMFMSGLLPAGTRDIVGRTIQLTGMILWLYVMWRTFRGDKVVIPGVGDAAERNS